MGRPTKYEPGCCEALDSIGHEGEGVAEAIQILGVSRQTFYTWQEEHPEFLDAVKDFKARSQAWWERAGRQATFGNSPGFSATSYIFNMKNRFSDDWKDKHEVENKHDMSDPMKEFFASVANASGRIGQR